MAGPSRTPFTRDFGRDVALFGAYNQRRLGLREAPVAAITGTVSRVELSEPYHLATMLKSRRYHRIRHAMADGVCLPPVDLYLLDGDYYIRDGHHRVLAARHLGLIDVDAEVTECLPTAASTSAAWHRERAAFERDTGLTKLHIRRLDGYEWLRRQIAEHGWYLGERGRAPSSFAEAAAAWKHDIYDRVLGDLDMYGALDRFPELTPAELYLAICDYKWRRGERLARDIGFAAALDGYRRLRLHPWLAHLTCWLEERWRLSVPSLERLVRV